MDNVIVDNTFFVEVVCCIYLHGVDNQGVPFRKCGFIEQDDHYGLALPSSLLNERERIPEVAVRVFKDYVHHDDLKTLDIVPHTFFDPKPPSNKVNSKQRTVYLSYRTVIWPGINVHESLRFMSHAELKIARPRIIEGHYQAYRAGIS
jgi:hypothetical protein